jgi:predicted ATPase
MRELAAERAAVREVITKLSLTPVMFETGARPHPPRALYRSYLDQSHVFVGIYYESYGWVAPEESVSGIEDEYRLSDRLPRLLYLKEPAPKRDPQLASLLNRIQKDDVASYRRFETTEELATLVTDDLMLLLSERFEAARDKSRFVGQSDIRLSAPSEPLLPILGRDDELAALCGLIGEGARLVTVTGAGGIGKSRLAVEAAHRCGTDLPIDVHFVDLTPLASAELVPAEIVKSLGIPLEGRREAIDTLTDHLVDRQLLLFLDNFEHVVDAATALLALISRCPGLQLLITSRHVLRVRGETEFPLAPLAVPAVGDSDDVIRATPSVRLFVQRAAAAQSSFELTGQNLEPVAEICRRLDGLPLALELAAARVRLLPPELLLDRLGTRLELLSSGATDLPERQRTLWSAIDWSHNLLSEDEQVLFAQLAVFVDGWTLDAAEAVCINPGTNVLDTLVSLLEKSLLVVVAPSQAGEPRMRMLVPVYEYAAQKLDASGERRTLEQRHADYFGNLVAQHRFDLRGAGQEAWSRRLSAEAGNLRAAVHWWIANSDGEALGRFLPFTHTHYWLTGTRQEFATWLRAADPLKDRMSRVTRGRFLITGSSLALDSIDLDVRGLGECAAAFEEALSLLEGTGQEYDVALSKIAFAQIKGLQGDLSAAIDALERLLELPVVSDDPWLCGMANFTAGGLALFAGNLDQAERFNSTVAALGRQIGSRQMLGMALERLAFGNLLAGHTTVAVAELQEAVDCSRRINHPEGLVYCLQVLANLLLTLGDASAAAEALAASDAARTLLGQMGPMGIWLLYKPGFETLRDQIHIALGDEFSDAWLRGQGVNVYAAADKALGALELVK